MVVDSVVPPLVDESTRLQTELRLLQNFAFDSHGVCQGAQGKAQAQSQTAQDFGHARKFIFLQQLSDQLESAITKEKTKSMQGVCAEMTLTSLLMLQEEIPEMTF